MLDVVYVMRYYLVTITYYMVVYAMGDRWQITWHIRHMWCVRCGICSVFLVVILAFEVIKVLLSCINSICDL